MKTRVYNKKIDIDSQSAKDFWNQRGNQDLSLKSIFLGEDLKSASHNLRNQKECEILLNNIPLEQLFVLDIGCGFGRWAYNLRDKIINYTGIDYSKGFINHANQEFSKEKNINFFEKSIADIDNDILKNYYNLVICTGVLMYVNDNDMYKIFDTLKNISPDYIYIQESISIINMRLTLNNFESKELHSSYSAIYRTKEEYEEYFNKYSFDIIKTDLLLDDTIGARAETNARYWVLKG